MQDAYDAIVVGSGFGGGIAACRLAEHPRHNPGVFDSPFTKRVGLSADRFVG